MKQRPPLICEKDGWSVSGRAAGAGVRAGEGGLTRKLCPKSVPFYQLVMDFVDSSCRVVDLCEKT